VTQQELDDLILVKEDEHVEFKEAKSGFRQNSLFEYGVALANEGGGQLVLGVTNRRPRRVVGTSAFENIEATKHNLLDALRLRVEIEEIAHSQGRVLVFTFPSRPIGMPLHLDGKYLMRSGESLVAMSADQLQRIFVEAGPDFSVEICSTASVADLEAEAIEVFRQRWFKKSGNPAIQSVRLEQLLEDSELALDGRVTYAALILMGSRKALGRYLPQAELILEYRASEDQIEASQRFEFRQGFLNYHDDLWAQINARNEVTSIRDGLFRREIPAFNEDAVREAVLNAICHRDYRLGGSIFVRQFPRRLEISSPGGLPSGITPDNILRKQSPRNRRLAEACSKCGLVERSGQGMDRIFDASLREGKGLPDFSGTDDHEVVLTMRGEVIDKSFIALLDLAEKHDIVLNVHHLVVLDIIRQNQAPPPKAARLIEHLVNIGLVEHVGKGKLSRLILSRGMYRYLGEPGSYTRYTGLDREEKKALILKHIKLAESRGASLSEFRQVLPQLTNDQVRHLVYELAEEGEVSVVGRAKNARWFVSSRRATP